MLPYLTYHVNEYFLMAVYSITLMMAVISYAILILDLALLPSLLVPLNPLPDLLLNRPLVVREGKFV